MTITHSNIRGLAVVLCTLWFVVLSASAGAGETVSKPPLVFSVHPYKSAQMLVTAYKPLTAYLSAAIGRPIKLVIAKDYTTHIDSIGENTVDIAYMGPASYVELVKRYGIKPLLARQSVHGAPTFQGKVIVRSDSTLFDLAQLKGKRFAFGDSSSTMSHLVPRYMLLQAGVETGQLSKYAFLGSHDNVALAVLSGDYDAGAVKEAVYEKYRSRGLKVLATTPALSEHLLVSNNKLSDELRQKITEALHGLKDSPQGIKIMKNIKSGMTAWVSVTDNDYDNLRIILDRLVEAGVKQ